MSFKLQAVSFKQFDRNMKAMARQISPQVGIADALEDGAWVISIQARDNAVAQGLIKSGALIDSIKPRKINQYRVDVEVGVPYGAAHEFGVTVTITAKQRRFFWAMYINTREDMWLALALSETYTIRAKPYLRPAIDERKVVAYGKVSQAMFRKLQEAIR